MSRANKLWGTLALVLVAVVVALGATGFSLAGGEKETRGYTTLATGTAQVQSCRSAGLWVLMAQQRCTAQVVLDQGPDALAGARTVELDPGQLGTADVGRAVPVALVSPESVSGRRGVYYDDGAVLVRNADRPLRPWSDVILVGSVFAVGLVLVSSTRRMEARGGSRTDPGTGLASRTELRSTPRGSASRRVVALWWWARTGLVLALGVGVARARSVLVVGTRSDENRWPGLDAALLLAWYLPVLVLLVVWGVASYRRAAQRSEVVWVAREGTSAITTGAFGHSPLAQVRSGGGPATRRHPRAAAVTAVVAVLLAAVALRGLSFDQPGWVDALSFAQAATVLGLAVVLVLPSEPRAHRLHRILGAAGHPLPTEAQVREDALARTTTRQDRPEPLA